MECGIKIKSRVVKHVEKYNMLIRMIDSYWTLAQSETMDGFRQVTKTVLEIETS